MACRSVGVDGSFGKVVSSTTGWVGTHQLQVHDEAEGDLPMIRDPQPILTKGHVRNVRVNMRLVETYHVDRIW